MPARGWLSGYCYKECSLKSYGLITNALVPELIRGALQFRAPRDVEPGEGTPEWGVELGPTPPPDWIGYLLPESEECPGQLTWFLLILQEPGPNSVYQYNGQTPIPKGTKIGQLAWPFATPLFL